MRAKLLLPFTIIVLILILMVTVQPIQAAPSYQTVPTAVPNNSPGGQLPSTTVSPTPTQVNPSNQGPSPLVTVYICGSLLILGLVVTFISILRRRRKSP
jgi:hypothetical protein